MAILLYAEHLLNIRTLSLQISLPTLSNQETRATLSLDGSLLKVTHEDELASIELPVQVPSNRNAAGLTLPAEPTKDISFRIALSRDEGSRISNAGNDEAPNVVPWTANHLTKETQVLCRGCQSVILAPGKISAWKDLPSENWAEMMDFWHCHRPSVPHQAPGEALHKGYTATSKLALEPGVAMVDPVDFVLAANDCQNLKTIALDSSNTTQLQCASCQMMVGHIDLASGGYKIRKLHLSLSLLASREPVTYGIDKWLACHLLSSTESQGVRRFSIQSVDARVAIKVWIFNSDMTISSSAAKTPEPIRAVKILWIDSPVSTTEGRPLTRQSLMEGELELPGDELNLLRQYLVQSAALLPAAGRIFASWNAALLPRFSDAEVQQARP